MSTFRNINIPTGGSYRINNVPLPVIDDSASSALTMYSSNQIVTLNTAQNLLITTLTNTVNQLVIDVNLLKNPLVILTFAVVKAASEARYNIVFTPSAGIATNIYFVGENYKYLITFNWDNGVTTGTETRLYNTDTQTFGPIFNLATNTTYTLTEIFLIITPYAKLAATHALGSSVIASGCSLNGAIIIVGGNINIVKISSDSGVSWASRTTNITSVDKICVSDSGQYILLGGGGMSFSNDYGVSFTQFNANPHAIGQNSGGDISITGFRGGTAKLYRATNVNSASQTVISASPTMKWRAVCVSDNGNIIVGVTVTEGQAYGAHVWVSQNAGATWASPLGAGAETRVWTHIHCSADGTKITLYQSGAGGDVWQSSDSGSTFTNKGVIGSWLNGEMSSNGVKRVGTISTNIKVSDDSGATWVDGTYAPTPAGGTWESSTISSDGTKTYMFYSNGDTYSN